MLSPTIRAQHVWPTEGGNDFLQLTESNGQVVGGINSLGVGFGSLAPSSISGSTNQIPKFTSSSALGGSALSDDGTNVSSTEPILVPAMPTGTASLGFAGSGGSGFNRAGANVEFIWQGFRIFSMASVGIQTTSPSVYSWTSSTTDPTGASLDTGLSRISAGIVAIGNGTGGDFSGKAKMTNLSVVGLQIFANNAAAISGGLSAGDFYRTGANPDVVCVVH